MKKYFTSLIIVCCFVVMAILPAPVFAGEDSSTAESAANAQILTQDNSINTSIEARQYITPFWCIPTSTLQPHQYESGWQVYTGGAFNKVISIKRMKAGEAWYERIFLGSDSTVWGKVKDNDAPILLIDISEPDLSKMSADEKKKVLASYKKLIGNLSYLAEYVFEAKPETDRPFIKSLQSALWEVKKETNAKYVAVFVKVRAESNQDSKGIGLGGALGKVMGPAASPDELVGSAGGGTGWNHTKAWIELQPYIKIMVFDIIQPWTEIKITP